MTMRATEPERSPTGNPVPSTITHPEDSAIFLLWGELVLWVKHPFDDYLWYVLVGRSSDKTFVTWGYNGTGGGSLYSGHYDYLTVDEATNDLMDRTKLLFPVVWREAWTTKKPS